MAARRAARGTRPETCLALLPVDADNAYFRAERRGFEAGHELDDWLQAEEEVERVNLPLPSY